MELLVQLLAEFGTLPLLAFGATAAFIALLLIDLASLLLPRFMKGVAEAFKARAWLRWVRRSFLGLLALVALGVLLLNTLLFEPSLRWIFSRVRARTGVALTFASASGNFFSGVATFKDLAVRRDGDPRSNFDLRAKEVRLDIRMSSALRRQIAFESLTISGLEGTYDRVSPHGQRTRGHDFVVDRLVLENSSVRYRDRPLDEKVAEVTIVFERLECAPFSRRQAVFDVLFRSTAQGTIDGAPFTIRTESVEGGRKTFWKGHDLPLRFLAEYAGGGFAWFRSGTAEVDVVDSWKDDESREIESRWKLRLKAFTAEVPAGMTGWKRPIAEAVVAYLNRHPVVLPLEFDLTINKESFEGATSVEATGLLVAMGEALAKKMAELAGLPAEKIKELGRRSLEAFREALDRWRKK